MFVPCLSPRKGVSIMARTALVGAGVLLFFLSLGSAAFAQTDCKKLVPASPWGPNDQTGATNRVTAAVTKAAAAEIQTGKVITMSYPLTDGVPRFGTRFDKTIHTRTRHAPCASFGRHDVA